MGKIIKDLIEDTFVKKNTNIYELSILMGVDSFDFMVLDSRQHLQALRSYSVGPQLMAQPSILASLVQGDELLSLPYRTVRVGWANGRNTLVPQRLYNEQKKESYLEHATDIASAEVVLADGLPGLNLRNVYVLPKGLESFTRQYFSGCRLFHISSALLEGINKLPVSVEGPRVYAHLRDGLLFVFVFEDKNLLFSNAFPFKSAKDFIYFLLLPYHQFGYKPGRVPAYLSGQLLEDSDIFREAFRYIKQASFVEPPAFFHLGPRASGEPRHFYFDLLGLSLCG
ncbi:MAG: DUF3822 family protein [Phaeodactylibacter sp.]|nr:DUF3822 family protein [Phaeodactylibacter sp.]MCB9263744.1 DUF3822 family protein [Lewinellaceae bacterium]MCB9286848.1 DUF3822 family protein [Lewinellaceae bacterium]